MSDAIKHECGIALVRLKNHYNFIKTNTVLLFTELIKCIY